MDLTQNNSQSLNGTYTPITSSTPTTLVCFSHLRWDFVYQRPQHLLSRFATIYSVYFVEEPLFDAASEATVTFTLKTENLWVVQPHLPANTSAEQVTQIQKILLDKFLKKGNSASSCSGTIHRWR
jgi:UDP-galactopyranose mutase